MSDEYDKLKYEFRTLNNKMADLMETYLDEPSIDRRATIAGMIILMKGFISEAEISMAFYGEDREPKHMYCKDWDKES